MSSYKILAEVQGDGQEWRIRDTLAMTQHNEMVTNWVYMILFGAFCDILLKFKQVKVSLIHNQESHEQ